jgi:DNA-binding IclR family transcriptional regulator
MGEAAQTGIYQSQVLDRTFKILDILAEQGPGIGITELAAKLGLHKSTTHRLIMVLESNRFVEKNANTGKYQLGSRVLELGLSALSRLDLGEVATPHLRRLVAESGETAHIGILRNFEVISILNVRSTQALHAPSEVGTRHPVHCSALGKAILAFSSREEVDQFLRERTLEAFTRNTITIPSMFIREIETVQRNGYALDDEEREEGLRCVGAPVWNSAGEVIGAVSVSGPVFRITRDRVNALAETVMEAASRMSASLGYRPKLPVNLSDSSAN